MAGRRTKAWAAAAIRSRRRWWLLDRADRRESIVRWLESGFCRWSIRVSRREESVWSEVNGLVMRVRAASVNLGERLGISSSSRTTSERRRRSISGRRRIAEMCD